MALNMLARHEVSRGSNLSGISDISDIIGEVLAEGGVDLVAAGITQEEADAYAAHARDKSVNWMGVGLVVVCVWGGGGGYCGVCVCVCVYVCRRLSMRCVYVCVCVCVCVCVGCVCVSVHLCVFV